MSCACEGSCLVCLLGEVENHTCNKCHRRFCPQCHGVKQGQDSSNVLHCACSEYVELFYNLKKYRVKKSDLDAVIEFREKIIMLPGDIAFNLSKMYIDPTDKHDNPLPTPRFSGSNAEFETFGQLPKVAILRAERVLTEWDDPKELETVVGPVCPICQSSDIEYLCDHWACHNCNWKTKKFEFKPEPPQGVNPNENICCDIGDDD